MLTISKNVFQQALAGYDYNKEHKSDIIMGVLPLARHEEFPCRNVQISSRKRTKILADIPDDIHICYDGRYIKVAAFRADQILEDRGDIWINAFNGDSAVILYFPFSFVLVHN